MFRSLQLSKANMVKIVESLTMNRICTFLQTKILLSKQRLLTVKGTWLGRNYVFWRVRKREQNFRLAKVGMRFNLIYK